MGRQVVLRTLTENDLLTLEEISRKTFFETFVEDNTSADMEQYLADKFDKKQLKKELNEHDSQFFFSELDEKATGYLKINIKKAQTENIIDNALEVERIYVVSEYQNKGIGQLLLDKAFEIARSKNIKDVWLGVWEKNSGAIAFYKRNGFTKFGKHIFKLGADEQIDIMMRCKL